MRNWTKIYGEFLSPSASPEKGKTRIFSEHDVRVLYFVSTLRAAGQDQGEIIERLKEHQTNRWETLPPTPSEWMMEGESIPAPLAASRASELAQLAVLQTEIVHIKRELDTAHRKVDELESNLRLADQRADTAEQEKTALSLELVHYKGEVARLEALLTGYSFGREKPVNIGFILVVTLLLGAALVIVAMLVAALIL
jgi:DNA-binding transcriptional MerR regulator